MGELLLGTTLLASFLGGLVAPIGLGATALSRLLIDQHTVVFLVGGTR